MASSELERMLRRRSEIIDRAEADAAADESSKLPASERPSPALSISTAAATQPANNPYNEFCELSRKQIQKCQKMFNRFAALFTCSWFTQFPGFLFHEVVQKH